MNVRHIATIGNWGRLGLLALVLGAASARAQDSATQEPSPSTLAPMPAADGLPPSADASVSTAPATEETPAMAAPDAPAPTSAPASERVELTPPGVIGMNPEHITLTLTDTELLQVVDLFIKVSGANIIASPTNLTGRVTVSLRDVPWQMALSSILDMHGLALVQGGPDSDVYSIMPKPAGAAEPLFVANFHLNFLRAENLADAAKILLEPMGRVLLAQGNNLSVMGTASKIRDVTKLVEDMDLRVPQVVVESKFVELNEEAIKNLGINWQVLEGVTATVKTPSYTITRETVRQKMDQDAQVFTSSGGNNTIKSSTPGASSTTSNNGGTTSTISGSNFSEYNDGAITMVPPMALTDTRALSAVLSASDLAVTLSALKENTGADIISNPKIIVSSGESATIHVGERRPNIIRKTSSTTSGASETTYEFGEPAWIDLGVKVNVTPTVNTESNITLRIVPELDRQIGTVEPTPGLTFPILVTRRIESEFALESGKTVAIGGLTQTTDREVVKKIPFLGDIPLIGKYLFSHSSTERVQDEVIIFVTLALANSESLNYHSGIPSQGRLISNRFTDPAAPQLQLRNRAKTPDTLLK